LGRSTRDLERRIALYARARGPSCRPVEPDNLLSVLMPVRLGCAISTSAIALHCEPAEQRDELPNLSAVDLLAAEGVGGGVDELGAQFQRVEPH
jgi:hypothetical protein